MLRMKYSPVPVAETAQLALWFGADDLDGTVQEEHIYHMAGSRTPEGMTTKIEDAKRAGQFEQECA